MLFSMILRQIHCTNLVTRFALSTVFAVVALFAFANATAFAQSAQQSENKELEPLKISLNLLAGLVLFLYGVSRLSESLKEVAGEKMREWLARFTTNRFAAVGTGTVATTLLDSSSVTIVMVIALVNAGLLTFTQSLGVIMGANVGTTISSQIFAFDLDEYSPLLLLAGFLLHVFSKSERWQQIGLAILSFGLIFFGLHRMGESVEPLQEYQPFLDWMKGLEQPVYGAIIGAVVTIVLQSSSATVGIAIALASQNLISLPAGIAVMLGAEIGTCADTLVASIGRSREAIRAGVFHLLFNIVTVTLGVIFVGQLTAFVVWMSGGAEIQRQIANAHMTFNILGVLLFIGFTSWIAQFLEWLIPGKKSKSKENNQSGGAAQTPTADVA